MSDNTKWGYIVHENLLNEVTIPRKSDSLELAVSKMKVDTVLDNPVLMAEDSAKQYMDDLAAGTVINSHKQIIGDVTITDYADAVAKVTAFNNGGTLSLDDGRAFTKTAAVEGDIVNFVPATGELEEGYIILSKDMRLSENYLKSERLSKVETNDSNQDNTLSILTEADTHNLKKENSVDVTSLGPINPLDATVSSPNKLPTREDIRSAGNAGYQEVLANKALINKNTADIATNLADIASNKNTITQNKTEADATNSLAHTLSTQVTQQGTSISDNTAQIRINNAGVDDWVQTKPRVALLTDIGGVVTITGDETDISNGDLEFLQDQHVPGTVQDTYNIVWTDLQLGGDAQTALVNNNKSTVTIKRKSTAPANTNTSIPDAVHVELPFISDQPNTGQAGYGKGSNTFSFDNLTVHIGAVRLPNASTLGIFIMYHWIGVNNVPPTPEQLKISKELGDNYYVSEFEQKNIKNLGLDQTARDDATKALAEATAAFTTATGVQLDATKNTQAIGSSTSGLTKLVADNTAAIAVNKTNVGSYDVRIKANADGITRLTTDLTNKQNKTDSSLSTNTKSVVGAINEVSGLLSSTRAAVAQLGDKKVSGGNLMGTAETVATEKYVGDEIAKIPSGGHWQHIDYGSISSLPIGTKVQIEGSNIVTGDLTLISTVQGVSGKRFMSGISIYKDHLTTGEPWVWNETNASEITFYTNTVLGQSLTMGISNVLIWKE